MQNHLVLTQWWRRRRRGRTGFFAAWQTESFKNFKWICFVCVAAASCDRWNPSGVSPSSSYGDLWLGKLLVSSSTHKLVGRCHWIGRQADSVNWADPRVGTKLCGCATFFSLQGNIGKYFWIEGPPWSGRIFWLFFYSLLHFFFKFIVKFLIDVFCGVHFYLGILDGIIPYHFTHLI